MRGQGLRPNGSVAFSLVKACARQDQDLARTYVEEFQANGIRQASSCSLQYAGFVARCSIFGNLWWQLQFEVVYDTPLWTAA